MSVLNVYRVGEYKGSRFRRWHVHCDTRGGMYQLVAGDTGALEGPPCVLADLVAGSVNGTLICIHTGGSSRLLA